MKNKTLKNMRAVSGDIPANAYTNESLVEVSGAGRCVVEGIQHIREYSPGKIVLELHRRTLTIHGVELFISSFTAFGAVVEGTIVSIDFSGGVYENG